jgi:hypothetical protein
VPTQDAVVLLALRAASEREKLPQRRRRLRWRQMPRTPNKDRPTTTENRMASRQIKMPAKDDAEKSPEANEVFSQRKRPELGRYLLQVDRQTKGSYTTSNAAQAAASAIKTGHPVVQVSVYDAVDHTYTIVEAPAAPAA